MTTATMSRPSPPPVKLAKIPRGIRGARIIINAVEGWGKTTFGGNAPAPAILMARGETGFRTLREAGRVPDSDAAELTSWNATLRMIESLVGSDYKTVVLDALGGFERLCHEHVCARDFNNDWGEKGFLAYGRGPDVSVSEWLLLLQRLDRLLDEGKSIVILSHAKPRTFKNPMGADFDRYTADCHEKTWGVTHKWADAVLFGTFLTVALEKRGSTRAKGAGGTERVIYTERTDAYDAKNRYGMPAQIDVNDKPDEMFSNIWNYIGGNKSQSLQAPEL